jgi:hypothetical protein
MSVAQNDIRSLNTYLNLNTNASVRGHFSRNICYDHINLQILNHCVLLHKIRHVVIGLCCNWFLPIVIISLPRFQRVIILAVSLQVHV